VTSWLGSGDTESIGQPGTPLAEGIAASSNRASYRGADHRPLLLLAADQDRYALFLSCCSLVQVSVSAQITRQPSWSFLFDTQR